MAVKKIITIANPILYKPSETVEKFDSSLRSLIRDMFDTMYEDNGVGLAAVQIGILKRVIVVDLEKAGHIKGAFINPEVVEASDDFDYGEEGCLSVPGVTANLKRPKWVKISYQNAFGEKLEIEGNDFMARALLHEIDHTLGKVFIDALEEKDRQEVEEDIEYIRQGKMPKHYRKPPYRED